MPPQIIISPQRKVHILLAMARGESDAHDASNVPRCQPALLVVIGPVQFPALVLQQQQKKATS